MNKKALYTFLGITFIGTILAVIIARLAGLSLFFAPNMASQLLILFAMFIPATAAIITQKFVVKKPLKELGFKLGDWAMYRKTYLVICGMFVLTFATTWIFFLKPDFTLASFMAQYNVPGGLPLPAWQMVAIFTFVTFVVAPIFNLIPSLGEEIGWRGFLLPTLEPLGKNKAMVISGMIWAVWHTPMIWVLGFAYGQQFLLGAVVHFILVTGLGVWFGHIWFKTRNTVLAGFMHAVFNANSYGIWAILFVSNNKLLIGGVGIISAVLWAVLAGFILWKTFCK